MTDPISGRENDNRHRLGFLLEPLGWVQSYLGKMIEAEPALATPLLALDHARMHRVALALAHHRGELTPDLVMVLLQGSKKAIFDLCLDHHRVGLDRVLHQLPTKVLEAESYRNLVALLRDSAPAKFLHHCTLINESKIIGLHRLPGVLRRPAIMAMFDKIDGMENFVDGLRIVATRARLPFETLAAQLGSFDQMDQVAAKIKQLVEALPLPDAFLPIRIGEFRRVDCVAEIRALAKQWKNCIAERLYNINDGTAAIYLSDECKIICFVCRYGRMGWFLLQARGPENATIDTNRMARIHSIFASADIPNASLIEAIREILLTLDWRRHRLVQDEEEAFEDVAVA